MLGRVQIPYETNELVTVLRPPVQRVLSIKLRDPWKLVMGADSNTGIMIPMNTTTDQLDTFL